MVFPPACRLIWQTPQIQNEICLNFPIEPDVIYKPSVILDARVSFQPLGPPIFVKLKFTYAPTIQSTAVLFPSPKKVKVALS
jgi:hypothetical protein